MIGLMSAWAAVWQAVIGLVLVAVVGVSFICGLMALYTSAADACCGLMKDAKEHASLAAAAFVLSFVLSIPAWFFISWVSQNQ